MTGRARPAIVVAATPTPNGDLHVGHMAGPYLSGDVYARYLRANGRQVVYTTCTDDSQSYVVSTAHRRGVTPEELVRTSTAKIERSLAAMGTLMAGLPPIDDRYRRTVLDYVADLHAAGRFRLRAVRLPYAKNAGRFLYDGLVTGTCPVCLAGSCGGACETCGHPNNFDELIDPKYTLDPTDPVVHRERTVLVLPMEEYRERLTSYYAARTPRWRPHAKQLVGELLARPLPDVPVTFPGTWGIPAPFPETPGQVLYPWIEAMPASIYSTWWTATRQGHPTGDTDHLWRAESDAELVYFHGFDNVYHWGLVDLVMLLAHGDRYTTPESNVCNEFYDLDGEKFSTSRNHLIWSADLLAEVPRDLVRFYLALTAPEYQRTNFSRDALHAVTTRRLVEPWNALADAVTLALVGVDASAQPRTTEEGRRRSAAVLERFRLCYELPSFSLGRAAETVLTQLGRLRALADAVDGKRNGHSPVAPGDLLLEARTLLACAAPILVDVADALRAAGVDLDLGSAHAGSVPVFRFPRLPATTAPTGLAPALDGAR
ncbi:class I tRNA ligase family protein [Saccharothrix algeriensis]|uniref:Class I tRNA ligase family protein n=1 Tax=Saccharothrix algeriensis TaxID=173560 RepID=A0A8T8HZ33_9PSEU|nr:class I tRNA ligase family protein [Saccharothrix algeriensis]MBM7809293.1 methionyl-tRNA synthetase [Saccharothrix algeriensis]QTR03639.1 class I tRNA ligase family protein [Saccharothrix algeriensis]